MNPQILGRLLIVDDESAQMKALCDTLEGEGYAATGFSSAKDALHALRAGQYDLLLTDLMMPEMDGIDFLHAARQVDPDLVGIVMTGHATIDTAVKAMQAGALDYIQKPFRLSVILLVVARALDLRRLRMENTALLERERRHIAELEAANRDLESFSYSVSHDLRAPLRAIAGFTDIYVEEFGHCAPEAGRELLSQVVRGAQRMDRLIEALLHFSRLSRQPLVTAPVNLKEVATHVIEELRAGQPNHAVDVRIGTLPPCKCDQQLVTQVFTNLLSNAFKFTRGRSPAVVEVDCREREGERVLFVRDNGAGFDMKYAGKLFGVFQRMHSEAEFEGTGVGLSIVQRIVQRHGGRIWAESEPGVGTTFWFTLAAADGSEGITRGG